MAEYAGFQEREGTDFAGSINDLATKVSGLESKVKEVRASDKKLLTDNDALLDAHKPFAYQDANDYVAASVPSIRAYQYDMYKKLNNREITPTEYRTAMQNQTTDWNNKIGLLKGFDEMTLEAQKRLEPGPNGEEPQASTKETQMFENRMKFYTDLKTKKMFINPNGKLADASVDENGKIIEGSIFDMKAQMNVNNIASNRFSLRNALEKDVKVLGTNSVFTAFANGSTEQIESIKNSKDFIAAKTDIVGKYISNDEIVGHILTDNSNEGYLVWSFPEQKEKLITDKINAVRLVNGTVDEAAVRKEMEAKMLHLKSDDNGVWSYQITPEMREIAKNVIEKQLLSQLGYTEKGTAIKNMTSGRLTEYQRINLGKEKQKSVDVYRLSASAMAKGDFEGLNEKDYIFKRKVDKSNEPYILVYKREKYKNIDITEDGIADGSIRPIKIDNPENLGPYLNLDTGGTPSTPYQYQEGHTVWNTELGNDDIFTTTKKKKEKETKKKEVKTKVVTVQGKKDSKL